MDTVNPIPSKAANPIKKAKCNWQFRSIWIYYDQGNEILPFEFYHVVCMTPGREGVSGACRHGRYRNL